MQINQALLETHFTAQRDDLRAHVLDHLDQLEGADMRMGIDQNLLWRTGTDKFAHDLAPKVLRVPDLAPQLAIRECAGTTLTELHVRLRLQHRAAPQTPGVLGALTHRLAAFQYDWTQAHLCQQQRGEHAAWPKTDHHRARLIPMRPAGRRLARCAVAHIRRRHHPRIWRQACQHTALQRGVAKSDIHHIHHQQGRLARVDAAFENDQRRQVSALHLQRAAHQRLQPSRVIVERQLEFVQANHVDRRAAQ